MNDVITGPAMDELSRKWVEGEISADEYLEQARELSRASAKRVVDKQIQHRISDTNGEPAKRET